MADRSKYGRNSESFNRNREHCHGSENFRSAQNKTHFQGRDSGYNEIRQPYLHERQLDGRNLTSRFDFQQEVQPTTHFGSYADREIEPANNAHLTGRHGQNQQHSDALTRHQQRLPPSNPSAYFRESSTYVAVQGMNNSHSQTQLDTAPQRTSLLATPFSTASQGSMLPNYKQTASNQSFTRLPPPPHMPKPPTTAVRPLTSRIPTQLMHSGPLAPQMAQSTNVPPPHLLQSTAVPPLRLAQSNGGQPPLFHSTAVPPPHLSQPVTSPTQLPQSSNIPHHFQQALTGPPLQSPQLVVKPPPYFTGTAAMPRLHPPQFVAPPPSQAFSNLATPRAVIPTGTPAPVSTGAGKPVAKENIEQQVKDQEWIEKFVLERKLTKEKEASRSCEQKMKIPQAKKLLQEWHELLEELDKQNTMLRTMETVGLDRDILHQELEKVHRLGGRIVQLQTKFSDPPVLERLKHKLEQRKKKREWWRRMRSRQYFEKMETDKNRIQLHRKIDEWREKIISSDQAKLRAQAMKSEAGGAMGEVRRKLVEANKALESLKALRKLRDIRQQEAEVKGVYPRPTRESNKRFSEKMDFLESLVTKQQQLYVTEERTLKVMMAEEEEEKDKETRKKFRHEMRQHGQAEVVKQYDPMDEFQRFYNQAELSLGSLMHVRRQWDLYMVPETVPGTSRIPDGLVSPVEPCSSIWASALQDKIASPEPSSS